MHHKILINMRAIWTDAANLNNFRYSQMFKPADHAVVLDLGCDNGELIRGWADAKIHHATIWGMDIEKKKIAIARKKYGIKALHANVEKRFPFKKNYFDLVTANQIIEHIHDVDFFIAEIHRVLKPGGYVLIATENLSSWHNIFALILGWQAFSQHISYRANIGNPWRVGKYTGLEKSGMHVKIFTLFGLKELLKLYGFKIEATFGAGFYPFTKILSKILSQVDARHSAFIGMRARKL
ncbi:class I SAM-dependent methyltransferase [Candidatus Microgenomates bacterium]|nr:MAG: class I SAM-dependent methyltransferase [Candidatus Microgenomates bacterium]